MAYPLLFRAPTKYRHFVETLTAGNRRTGWLGRQDSNRRAGFGPFAIMAPRKSRQMSKNVIQIGLAFSVSQSGTVLAKRAFTTLREPALPA